MTYIVEFRLARFQSSEGIVSRAVGVGLATVRLLFSDTWFSYCIHRGLVENRRGKWRGGKPWFPKMIIAEVPFCSLWA
jgi:hypothetical protein